MVHSAAHSLTMKLPHNQEEEGEQRNHELAQRKERSERKHELKHSTMDQSNYLYRQCMNKIALQLLLVLLLLQLVDVLACCSLLLADS